MDCTETVQSRTHVVTVLGADAKLHVSGSAAQKIGLIASRQRGRVNRKQLLAAGISYGVTTRLVKRGVLTALPSGVFAFGDLGATELAGETAALLAAREGSLLSHYSAAVLWDMLRPQDGDGLIHITAPGATSQSRDGVAVHRSRVLSSRDARIHRRLPVTSPAWTLFDLSETVSRRRLELAFDRGLVAGVLRLVEVDELLGRMHGRVGTRALRALRDLHRTTTITRSEAEEMLLALLRRAQIDLPRVNARVHGYEVDFFWPQQRLVVEIDGFRFHSTRRAFEHDRRKDQDLRARGLTVLRFTYHQLQREPFVVVHHVARALGAAGALATVMAAG